MADKETLFAKIRFYAYPTKVKEAEEDEEFSDAGEIIPQKTEQTPRDKRRLCFIFCYFPFRMKILVMLLFLLQNSSSNIYI